MARRQPFQVETPRIVPANERRMPWVLLLALPALAGWSWLVYEYALRSATPPVDSTDSRAVLVERIAALEQERDDLRALLEGHASAQAVPPADADEQQRLREEVAALKEQRDVFAAAAENHPTAAEAKDFGLEIRDPEIFRDGAAPSITYRFKIARQAPDDDKVEGELVVASAGDTADGATHKLGFRRFQVIEGQLPVAADADGALRVDVTLSQPEDGSFSELLAPTKDGG